MKNTRKCPKCGSEEVLRIKGNDVSIRERGYNVVPLWFGYAARIDRWVCCTCGYSEEWVEKEALEDVKSHWKKKQVE